MAAPLGAAISQSPTPSTPSIPRTLTLRVDNDAFDFWMLPWNRPDEEYSSGVHITYGGGDAPRWARGRLSARPVCAVHSLSCRDGRLEIGQDIYTPSVPTNDPHAAPGSRPNAGWLYLSQSARALDENSLSDLTISLGVTGPPSLARFTQRLAHDAAPQYNRPTDWTEQIHFEPGAIVKYERRGRVTTLPDDGFGADLIPRASVSVGNILTAAEAGFQTRLGWHMSHPWLAESQHAEVTFMAGAYGQAIARSIFLDGNSFADSPRVGHKPFVGAGEAGVEIRYGALTLGYRAVNETRAWVRGPAWHPWASMTGGLTFDR